MVVNQMYLNKFSCKVAGSYVVCCCSCGGRIALGWILSKQNKIGNDGNGRIVKLTPNSN